MKDGYERDREIAEISDRIEQSLGGQLQNVTAERDLLAANIAALTEDLAKWKGIAETLRKERDEAKRSGASGPPLANPEQPHFDAVDLHIRELGAAFNDEDGKAHQFHTGQLKERMRLLRLAHESLSRICDFEMGEHHRHHMVENDLRATLAVREAEIGEWHSIAEEAQAANAVVVRHRQECASDLSLATASISALREDLARAEKRIAEANAERDEAIEAARREYDSARELCAANEDLRDALAASKDSTDA